MYTQMPSVGFFNRAPLIVAAQAFCDASMTQNAAGSNYNGWSSMSTLIEKGLVVRENNPSRYRLTDDGIELAARIVRAQDGAAIPAERETAPYAPPLLEQTIDLDSDLDEITTFDSGQPLEISFRTSDGGPAAPSVRSSQPKAISQLPKDFTPIVMAPGTFKLHLLIDNREIKDLTDRQAVLREAQRAGISAEVKPLSVGDFLWVARCHHQQQDIVLDYVIERKRIDDLVSSIKDNRFKEQKVGAL